MEKIIIRRASLKDANAAYPIYFHSEVNPFMHHANLSLKKFKAEWRLFLRTSELYVVESDKKVVGFGAFHTSNGRCSHVAELNMFAIDPSYQFKGLGRQLMNFFIRLAKEKKVKRLQLIVECDNLKAIRFYKKLGFKQEGRLKRYFRRSNKYIDDYIMARLL